MIEATSMKDIRLSVVLFCKFSRPGEAFDYFVPCAYTYLGENNHRSQCQFNYAVDLIVDSTAS